MAPFIQTSNIIFNSKVTYYSYFPILLVTLLHTHLLELFIRMSLIKHPLCGSEVRNSLRHSPAFK